MKHFLKRLIPVPTVLVAFALCALPSYAADAPPTIMDFFGKVPGIIDTFIAVATVVFFFMLIVAGYLFMTAGGDKKKIDNAKKSLLFSVVGFALIFLPFLAFPLIGRVAGVKTGFLVNLGNGNININIGSTYTPTPLPSDVVNTAPPISIFSMGNFDTGDLTTTAPLTSRNGCNLISVYGGVPVFYQYMWTNSFSVAPEMPGGPSAACSEYGEYDGSTGYFSGSGCDPTDESCRLHNKNPIPKQEAEYWEWQDCSAAAMTTVVDTWLNREGQNGDLIISDGINGLLHYNALSGGFDGSYDDFGRAANYMMQQHGKSLQLSEKLVDGFQNQINTANTGNPVIFHGVNHFLVLLHVTGDTAYVADPGRVLYFFWGGSMTKDGITTVPVSTLYNFWHGRGDQPGILLTPSS